MKEWQIVKVKGRLEILEQALEMFESGEYTARGARDFVSQMPDGCTDFMPFWYSTGTAYMLTGSPDLFIIRARQMVMLIDAYVESVVAAQKAKT